MRYYRCKCGNRSSLSSYGPPACAKCAQCGSDLAEHPDEHRDPVPHDFSGARLRDGKTTVVCCYCRNSREDLGLP